jgi:hypothetical protein
MQENCQSGSATLDGVIAKRRDMSYRSLSYRSGEPDSMQKIRCLCLETLDGVDQNRQRELRTEVRWRARAHEARSPDSAFRKYHTSGQSY